MGESITSVVMRLGRFVLFSIILCCTQAWAADEPSSPVEEGKVIAFDRTKGNCLACHQIQGGSMAGNVGPPLNDMAKRYPDKSKLRAQVWDATVRNPKTAMPPFGRHQILSEEEIDKVVEYISTL